EGRGDLFGSCGFQRPGKYLGVGRQRDGGFCHRGFFIDLRGRLGGILRLLKANPSRRNTRRAWTQRRKGARHRASSKTPAKKKFDFLHLVTINLDTNSITATAPR